MSSITLEELAGKKRILTLQGGGLPFQGAEWVNEQVVETTFLPGNPSAVQHVFGPTSPPSEWTGEWNTTRLVRLPCLWEGDGGEQQLVLADDVRNAMQSLIDDGQRLRVIWIGKPGRRVARYGRAVKGTFPTTRADDIKWTVRFEWTGRVDATVPLVQSDQQITSLRAAALAAADSQSRIEASNIISSNRKVAGSATPFTLGNLEQLAAAPLATVQSFGRAMGSLGSRLNELASTLQKTSQTPSSAAASIGGATAFGVRSALNFVNEMSRFVPDAMSSVSTVPAILSSANYFGAAQDSAEVVAEKCAVAFRASQPRRSAVTRLNSPASGLIGSAELLRTYMPKAGDTMVTIAIRFYGEDLSYELSRVNGLPGSTIVPPRSPALIIPVKSALVALRK